jgi:hypothetical protein
VVVRVFVRLRLRRRLVPVGLWGPRRLGLGLVVVVVVVVVQRYTGTEAGELAPTRAAEAVGSVDGAQRGAGGSPGFMSIFTPSWHTHTFKLLPYLRRPDQFLPPPDDVQNAWRAISKPTTIPRTGRVIGVTVEYSNVSAWALSC